MSVLSVDLALTNWSDLGVVLLERRGALIACEIMRWNGLEPPPVVELAVRLNATCIERDARVLMMDGPQAWKSEDDRNDFGRLSERELNSATKIGLPGKVAPASRERFVGYCLALYEALGSLGWHRLSPRDHQSAVEPRKILVESYPHAAWKSLGIAPLPAKGKCRVSNLAQSFAALSEVVPVVVSGPPNRNQLQAIVGGLPGLAIEERNLNGMQIVGKPPRLEGGQWREGFIALPLPPRPISKGLQNIRWMS